MINNKRRHICMYTGRERRAGGGGGQREKGLRCEQHYCVLRVFQMFLE